MSSLASLARYAIAGIARRRRRTASLVVGLALTSFLVSANSLVSQSLRAELARGERAMPDLVVQSLVGGRPAVIGAEVLDALRSRPGVRTVRGRVFGYLYLPSVEANVTVVGLDDREPSDHLVAGRMPRARHELTVGAALAEALGLRVGDTAALPVAGRFDSFRVVGIFRGSTALRTADVALAPTEDARALLGIPEGAATDLAVDLTTPSEAVPVAREIRSLLPGARVLERDGVARTHALTVGARSGFVLAMLLPALFALALLVWDRMTGLDEAERREIAVLKIVGWSTGEVLLTRTFESALLGLSGTCLGFAFAYFFVFFLEAPVLRDALFGWSRLTPHLRLVPSVGVGDFLMLLGLVTLPFSLAGLLPDYRAAMRDPSELLRQA